MTEGGKAKSSEALPSAWIERIFERLSAIYGNRFAAMWATADAAEVKKAWATGLGGFTAAELAAGLGACLSMSWPPTLPEFITLCRPPIEYETLFIDAAHARHTPLTYWAAQRFGAHELRTQSYKTAAKRWQECIDEVRGWGVLPAIPETAIATLPAPGQTQSPDVAREAMAEIRRLLGAGAPASPIYSSTDP